MIIGVSGKKQVGKSTTGKIIYDTLDSSWQFKSFADPIKQCASLILGISIEDFEKEEVKNSYLPEEWNKWRLISKEEWNEEVQHVKFFNTLPEVVKYQHYNIGLSIVTVSLEYVQITVRQFLQWFGTDACRSNVHENIWVNALIGYYKPRNKGKKGLPPVNERYAMIACDNCQLPFTGYKRAIYCPKCVEDDSFQIYPNWIISDVRFPNEVKAIKDKGGIVLRLERNTGLTDLHDSETALDNYKFEHVIDNNGTIDELKNKIVVKLQDLQIL